MARELTKKYEEFIRGNIGDLLAHLKENPPKGEIVLLCEGASSEEGWEEENLWEELSIKDHILSLMEEGLDKKAAIKEVARLRNLPKREVYKEALDI